MTPDKLKNFWKTEIIKVSKSQLSKFNFQPVTLEFLSNGMIDEFGELVFSYLKEEIHSVKQLWYLEDDYYDKLICIGHNGSGDPVVINTTRNDQLIYLNHDNGFEEVYINQNIERFLETVFRVEVFNFMKKPLTSDSFYITEFSDEQYEKLSMDLKAIDRGIFENNSFWKYTIEYYLWEREEERKVEGNKR